MFSNLAMDSFALFVNVTELFFKLLCVNVQSAKVDDSLSWKQQKKERKKIQEMYSTVLKRGDRERYNTEETS